jgi:hypothetical protein
VGRVAPSRTARRRARGHYFFSGRTNPLTTDQQGFVRWRDHPLQRPGLLLATAACLRTPRCTRPAADSESTDRDRRVAVGRSLVELIARRSRGACSARAHARHRRPERRTRARRSARRARRPGAVALQPGAAGRTASGTRRPRRPRARRLSLREVIAGTPRRCVSGVERAPSSGSSAPRPGPGRLARPGRCARLP